MKLRFAAMVLALCSLFGCRAKDAPVTGLIFHRGHGSAWGNQFSIEVNGTEIVTAEYIENGELVTVTHVPISEAQWQAICTLAEQLPLEKARSDVWDKYKLDGGEFRKLTLVQGTAETKYRWPDTPEAEQLEQLLEALVRAPQS